MTEEKIAKLEAKLEKLRQDEPKKKKRKRTGKYAHVIDKLPLSFNLDATYQDRITQTINSFVSIATEAGATLDAPTLAAMYEECRHEKAEIDEEMHEINLRLEALEQMVFNEFEANDITTVKTLAGASVRTEIQPHAQVKDKEVYRLWCIKNGYEQMMSLPWQTTNQIVKERLLEAEKEPDGVEVIAMPKVVFRKGE